MRQRTRFPARRGRGRTAAPLLVLLLSRFLGAPPAARGQAPEAPPSTTLAVAIGAFDVGRQSRDLGAGLELAAPGLGLRSAGGRLRLAPVVGVGTSRHRAFFTYFGAQADLALDPRWSLRASFALTRYSRHDDADLGGPVLFRESLALLRRTASGLAFGLSFFHISNGHTYRYNPGTNQLSLVIELPLGGRVGP